MKSQSWASWQAAQELPDREDEEITEWSVCEKHGKYPTEATEIIGEGYRICPICYQDVIKQVRCGTCNCWSRKGSHGTGFCSKLDDHRDARLKIRSCWEPKRRLSSLMETQE